MKTAGGLGALMQYARSLSFYREASSHGAVSWSSPQSRRTPSGVLFLCLVYAGLLGLSACQPEPSGSGDATASTSTATSQASPATPPAAQTSAQTSTGLVEQSIDGRVRDGGDSLKVLVFGDSISAAYGIERDDGWAALLQTRLATIDPHARAINASVSGETTQGGRARLQAALDRHRPDLVFIELGGNDALRGYPVSQMTDNLTAMVNMAQNSGARVVLLGMQIPPNYGPRYTRDFAAAFPTVATATNAYLVPFFLEGVALEANMIQSDGIHPTTLAQPLLLETGWQALVASIGDLFPEVLRGGG